MRRVNFHPRGPIFSFGEGEGVVGFIGSQCVPHIVPQVLNVFPNMFSIARTLIIFFVLGQSMMYITKGKKFELWGAHHS
jgi:hypothetical protein